MLIPKSASLQLAHVLGALSFATDLAAAVPVETSLRTCIVAATLARALGAAPGDQTNAYYTTLLRHLGCTGFAHEASVFWGDDHALLRSLEASDAVEGQGSGDTAILGPQLAAAQCHQAVALASDLGMSGAIVRALAQVHERFDGQGSPDGLAGAQLEFAARVLHVARTIEIQHRLAGRDRAEDEVRRRSGAQLDPEICRIFLADLRTYWSLLEMPDAWQLYLDVEPEPRVVVGDDQLDSISLAFAHYADLKFAAKLDHSTNVAALAVRAGVAAGLPADELEALKHAALLHDLGVVGISNRIWEKAGPLTPAEWEHVRLHAYYTDRIVARLPGFAPVALLASADHERCDGTGYPHHAGSGSLTLAARILASADVYCALTEARPYRGAFTAEDAARVLYEEARALRLGGHAVDVVLAVAEWPAGRHRTALPGGLTERERQVLVHLGRGVTNKEIATTLGISGQTVKRHLENIYLRLGPFGISTRSAAAVFAIRHRLADVAERNK